MIILHGAFDRHNYGDLLFPHVLQATRPDSLSQVETVFTGCAARSDMTRFGGYNTEALRDVLRSGLKDPVFLVHAGGEVLTADRASVGARLLDPQEAKSVSGVLGSRALALGYKRITWGTPPMPYVIDVNSLPIGSRTAFNAVGGVSLLETTTTGRDYVIGALRRSSIASYRDSSTAQQVGSVLPEKQLVPDTATLFPRLFEKEISDAFAHFCAQHPTVRPEKYILIQMNQQTARSIAAGSVLTALREIAEARALSVVVCSMGEAPFHDDPTRLVPMVREYVPDAVEYRWGDLWTISGLIQNAALFVGSSLHGRIIAMGTATPRVSITSEDRKVSEYVATWDSGSPGLLQSSGPLQTRSAQTALTSALEASRASLRSVRDESQTRVASWLDDLWACCTEMPDSPPTNGGRSRTRAPMARGLADDLDLRAWRGLVKLTTKFPERDHRWWLRLRGQRP